VILPLAALLTVPSAAGRTGKHDRGTTPTVVSLEFDHAFTNQLPAIQLANSLGIKATVFAMSGRVGLPGYMTVAQLQQLQAAGNEVGGHTIGHADLSLLTPPAQRHEICADRVALEGDGLDVTDFAYPYGHFDAATPGIVRQCGYQSARGAGGLASQGGCSGPCPPQESIPPANPFDTRTVNSVLETTSLSTIEGYVTRAERAGGGWVQIVFHYVCDGCDPYSVTVQTFSAFVSWLALRRSGDVRAETVRQVIHTPFHPPAVGRERRRKVRRHGHLRPAPHRSPPQFRSDHHGRGARDHGQPRGPLGSLPGAWRHDRVRTGPHRR
jgi:peptidoglycan/xylan/chitin deacetylase (PgdA/CDA1 family)